MQILMASMLILLLVLAVSVTITKKLLPAVIIFMFYSLVMSAVWLILESPDLAITEAAVGAGITSVLFFVTLKRLKLIAPPRDDLSTPPWHGSVSAPPAGDSPDVSETASGPSEKEGGQA